ncbi:hypothetical protein Tco_0282639 [Tanacetum coccineum]
MLDDFDRQDVLDLHRLVQERYDTTSPEGYDLLLWGDLKNLFEPNEEDEIWKNQQDYNLISRDNVFGSILSRRFDVEETLDLKKLNTAEDLRLPEEVKDSMKIMMCEKI